MTIQVQEPWFTQNDRAVFTKTDEGFKLLYWACDCDISGGECMNCSRAVEVDYDE